MIRRPPRSTLFPSRRSSDLPHGFPLASRGHYEARSADTRIDIAGDARRSTRSEEHTSELQSQFHLVCRLLLEKKKKNTLHRLMHTVLQVRYSTVDQPRLFRI